MFYSVLDGDENIGVTNMTWVLLLIVSLLHLQLVTGNVKADCGDPVNIDDSALLTCSIEGSHKNGVAWKRNGEKIITCFKNRKCISSDDTKYLITVNTHNTDLQQFKVTSVESGDFSAEWECSIDFTNITSTCNIKERMHASTEITCGHADIGSSAVLKCSAHKIQKGIDWFRGNEKVIDCNKKGQCTSNDESRYLVINSKEIQIIETNQEDFQYQWACVDNDILFKPLPQATCKLSHGSGLSLSDGEIAGIVVAVFLLIVIIIIVGLWIFRQVKLKKSANPTTNNSALATRSKSQRDTYKNCTFNVLHVDSNYRENTDIQSQLYLKDTE